MEYTAQELKKMAADPLIPCKVMMDLLDRDLLQQGSKMSAKNYEDDNLCTEEFARFEEITEAYKIVVNTAHLRTEFINSTIQL